MSNKEKDFEVGYGKPPATTRFQKSTSGNPSGRPKKAQQLLDLDPGVVLQSIDSEVIVVVDNGTRKRMTKAEINFRQLFTKAIKGDLRAARLIFDMAKKYFAPEAQGEAEIDFITETEAAKRFGSKSQVRLNAGHPK